MGIQQMEESLRPICRGVIRLGTKDEGDRGRMYNTEHFILRDAPDVERVYGPDPTELDVIFAGNFVDEVAPASFQHWISLRNASGERDGFKQCEGDGPTKSGTPGRALWYNRRDMPPADECLSDRDPASGYVQRACYGDGARGACRPCIQFKDKQCGPVMEMTVILPRVSLYESYRISTKSWNTIANVRSQLLVFQRLGIPLTSRVFTLFKEKKSARPWIADKQKEFLTSVNVVKMRENKDFEAKYGQEVLEARRRLELGGLRSYLPETAEVQALPRALDSEPLQVAPAKTMEQLAEELMSDPEILGLFDTLEHYKGKKYTEKQRRLAILNKAKVTNEVNLRGAVITTLIEGIDEARAAVEVILPAQPDVPQEATPEVIPVSPESPVASQDVELASTVTEVVDSATPTREEPGMI